MPKKRKHPKSNSSRFKPGETSAPRCQRVNHFSEMAGAQWAFWEDDDEDDPWCRITTTHLAYLMNGEWYEEMETHFKEFFERNETRLTGDKRRRQGNQHCMAHMMRRIHDGNYKPSDDIDDSDERSMDF